MAEAQIKAIITADDRASRVLAGFGNATRKTAKTIAVGIGVAAAAAVAFGVSAVKAFSESQNATAQLNAVLKSTKSVAGVTAKAATELANSLQKVTKFSDESILGGENLLLTFTKIGKDIFPQATEVMLDMSTALGQDLKSSAVQLGKALQDPVLGITALRRVGVNFSDAQKEVIKNLVDTGRSAEAQRLILKELQVEFGGSAKAAGKTFAGQLAILKNQFDEVKETIGATIVGALVPFATKAATFIASIDWQAVINRTIAAIKTLWKDYLVPFGSAVAEVATKVGDYLLPKLQALWNTLNEKLIPALKTIWKDYLEPLIPVIGTALVVAVGLAIDGINLLATALSATLNFILSHKGEIMALVGIITVFVLPALLLWSLNLLKIQIQAGLTAIANVLSATKSGLIWALHAQRVLVSWLITFAKMIARGAVAAAQAVIQATKAGVAWVLSADKSSKAVSAFHTLVGKKIPMGPIVVVAALAAIALVAAAVQSVIEAINVMNAAHKSIDAGSAIESDATKRLQQLVKTGTPAQKARAQKSLAGMATNRGFAVGGFTGRGGENQVAGLIHKGEYVIPKSQVDQNTGTPRMGGGSTVNFNVNIGIYAGSEIEKRRVAQELLDAMKDIASRKNMSLGEMI